MHRSAVRAGMRATGQRIALAIAIVAIPALQSCQRVETRQGPALVASEELVYARATDGIVSGGALFRARSAAVKPIAVIWIHGTGVNFYYPSYVKIARELASRGVTTVLGNTRMHDLGNIAAFRDAGWIRGGTYWGITTDQVRDLAAWIKFADERGFHRVILVGHSAGATAVQIYESRTQDPHVAGLVLASGHFRAGAPPVDSARLEQARRLVAEGRGEDPTPPIDSRPNPRLTSAATLVEWPTKMGHLRSAKVARARATSSTR